MTAYAPITIKELKRRLAASSDDDREIHIQIDTLGVPIGPTPSVPVTGVYLGIDWDHGKIMLTTAPNKLSRAGEEFEVEREAARKAVELTMKFAHILNGKLTDKGKIEELKFILERSKDK